MANGAALKGKTPFRGFITGYPGGGKTGCIASLLNAGYKVRMINMDGNIQSLVDYCDEKALDNLDIVVVQDKMRNGDKYFETVGLPTAFNEAVKLASHWKYTDPDTGELVDLGRPADWGSDTVLVLDNNSDMGEAALRRAIKMSNKTPGSMTSATWGMAVADQTAFLKLLAASSNKYHLLVLAHLRMISPEDFIKQGDDAAVVEKKLEAIQNSMIPTRLYPVAITKDLSTKIHKELPTMILCEQKEKLGKMGRYIRTVGGPELDLKIPSPNVKAEYPLETGLATIFEAMGYKAPGFEK